MSTELVRSIASVWLVVVGVYIAANVLYIVVMLWMDRER